MGRYWRCGQVGRPTSCIGTFRQNNTQSVLCQHGLALIFFHATFHTSSQAIQQRQQSLKVFHTKRDVIHTMPSGALAIKKGADAPKDSVLKKLGWFPNP